MTVPSDQGPRPQLAEVSSPALPTRSMEIIRTPGVAREQEYVEREMYAGNVLNLDTRLLQDIISGKMDWTATLWGPLPAGTEIASIILLSCGMVDLENMKLLLAARDQP